MRHDEHHEQVSLIAWAEWASFDRPELAMLFAIPNGGARDAVTGAKMKAEGVKPGVPDLCLPVARCGYHGLYIEMKRRDGGRVSPVQQRWIDRLTEQGYRVVVCHGRDEAERVIVAYLEGGPMIQEE